MHERDQQREDGQGQDDERHVRHVSLPVWADIVGGGSDRRCAISSARAAANGQDLDDSLTVCLGILTTPGHSPAPSLPRRGGGGPRCRARRLPAGNGGW